MLHQRTNHLVSPLILFLLAAGPAFGAIPRKKARKSGSPSLSKRLLANSIGHRIRARRVLGGPWKMPTFADATQGDSSVGEELTVRRAAVSALEPYNGTVIVADAKTGRILTIVNQKLALQNGFTPCSIIKIVAALAALKEGVLQDQNTLLHITRRYSIDLTQALAHSNNQFFAIVGVKLGYERVLEYAHLFGLGERAGWNVVGEQPGSVADEHPALGMLTTFGEGIQMTPLELTALMAAVANGGTLYYLQRPPSDREANEFVPRVKRRLDIAPWLAEIKPGMLGAVKYGTARRANFSPTERIFGKTGTCTDTRSPTHLGWFGSYKESGNSKLVVVVLLTGGYGVSGPIASGVAGAVYRNLSQCNYFAHSAPTSELQSLLYRMGELR